MSPWGTACCLQKQNDHQQCNQMEAAAVKVCSGAAVPVAKSVDICTNLTVLKAADSVQIAKRSTAIKHCQSVAFEQPGCTVCPLGRKAFAEQSALRTADIGVQLAEKRHLPPRTATWSSRTRSGLASRYGCRCVHWSPLRRDSLHSRDCHIESTNSLVRLRSCAVLYVASSSSAARSRSSLTAAVDACMRRIADSRYVLKQECAAAEFCAWPHQTAPPAAAARSPLQSMPV